MLFASEETNSEIRALVGDRGPLQWTEEETRAIVHADPEDLAPLLQLADFRLSAGDPASAEELLWQAADLYPATWIVYRGLARLANRRGDEPLASGVGVLELFYLAQDPSAAEKRFRSGEFRGVDKLLRRILDRDRRLPPHEQVRLLSAALSEVSKTEPAEVREKLQRYRSLRSLSETEDMTQEQVDAILGDSKSMTPLLVGVLRGWARQFGPLDPGPARKALALLGEIADLSTVRAVVETGSSGDSVLEPVVNWAFNRMKAKGGEAFDSVVVDIAGKGGLGELIVLLKAVAYHNRQWAMSLPILDLVAGSVGRLSQSERDMLFPMLVMTLMTLKHRPGVEQARKLLRENVDRLSRDVRSECDTMIAELGPGPYPNLPAPVETAHSVYSICTGAWSDTAHDEFEDGFDPRGDDFEPPEPIHRVQRPGRNDPCWCGSGKKYKKCHLDADDQGAHSAVPARPSSRMGAKVFLRLQRDLIAFKDRELSSSERRATRAELFGPDDREPDEILLAEWTVHDWVSPRFGRTIAAEYLRRNRARLSPEEHDVLHGWESSHFGLYEVTEVRKGTGLGLKDMTSGEITFVHDVNMSNVATRSDGMLVRVVKGERGDELGGAALSIAREHLAPLLEWMESDKRQAGLPWREYMKNRFPQIRRQLYRMYAATLSGLNLQNTDGEEFVLCTAAYRIERSGGLLAGLDAAPAIVEDVSGRRYSWLKADKTVLGSMTIEGEQLKFECNSRARLRKGKELLAGIAGDSIHHMADEFTSKEEILNRVRTQASQRERE